ncbi:glycosyltransferase [Maribacter sp. Asnod1-A12]|uniref:glycosyltransferase n=1 Tax=Maribacter sp. Asnod1-A12 TaxID=3160576 RepID=UPI003870915C
MKLSIIIPLYNKEKYIERCLDSLLSQGLSFLEYEIIMVDDGSIDASALAVKNYAKKNLNVNIQLIPQKNQGPSAARNNGLLQAKGSYVYFLDADDFLTQGSLSYLLKICEENDLDILEFDTKEIDEGLLPIENSTLPNNFIEENIAVWNGHTFIENNDLRNQAWRYLIKKSYLLETGITFIKEMYAYEDLIFTANVFLQSKRISKVNFDAHRYIKVAGSIVTTKNPEKNLAFVIGMVRAVEELHILIKELEISKEENNQVIIKLRAKQQAVVYALLIRAFKYKLDPKEVSTILDKMNTLEAYPIDSKKGTIDKGNLIQNLVFFPLVNNRKSLLLALKMIKKL